jgi:hypothetical protein
MTKISWKVIEMSEQAEKEAFPQGERKIHQGTISSSYQKKSNCELFIPTNELRH